MSLYTVATFYAFTPLPDYETFKPSLLKAMKANDIRGTIILASEGINGTICGQAEEVLTLEDYLRQIPGLMQLAFRHTSNDFNPFEKAKVKLRQEIVTLGTPEIDPNQMSGQHVTPEEWNNLIHDPDVVIIDTRNHYEVELGAFVGAINPETDNFRDFPHYVESHLLDKKDKKIAMYCTGGIRCEKSTAYLKKLGFQRVYQLQGGILHYLQSIPTNLSKWEGNCFVFDERVALDPNLQSLEKGTIDPEWKNRKKTQKNQC